ncbi:sesquipedalian-1-like [Carcharodon carcharias]|uniref:sesquipedalian-1-like n=1 Tax=Carcharodon carcharias TaxID=13397 RepID=UPI001B7F478C|nr:sesquipedalian-1-like [Carcharodon carcharias]XP_041036965.1 sesquipedalian-1-like [Carcharodon carcharias]
MKCQVVRDAALEYIGDSGTLQDLAATAPTLFPETGMKLPRRSEFRLKPGRGARSGVRTSRRDRERNQGRQVPPRRTGDPTPQPPPPMKLNTRAVAAYALRPWPVDRQGFLLMKGQLKPSYHRRWFVLRGNLLFYFERPGEAVPQGLVLLEGCAVELCPPAPRGGSWAFSLGGGGGWAAGGRRYELVAEGPEEQEAWVRALSCASLAYLRGLVRDLQAQYDGLHRSPGWGGAAAVSPATLWREAEGRSLGAASPPGGRRPRRWPGPWPSERAARDPRPQPQAPNPPDDFLSLHRRYGAEVERARREWQLRRARGVSDQPPVGTLIDWS